MHPAVSVLSDRFRPTVSLVDSEKLGHVFEWLG